MSSACVPWLVSNSEAKNLTEQLVYSLLRESGQNGNIMAEYIWIGGSAIDIRSKTKTLSEIPTNTDQIPIWTFNGCPSGEIITDDDCEIFLNPVSFFRDPLRGGDNILVFCDTYEPPTLDEKEDVVASPVPSKSNTRYSCNEIMDEAKDQEPWFGIEQEYTLLNSETMWPLGWPKNEYSSLESQSRCSVGIGTSTARTIVECHYKACLAAGISISSASREATPSQWKYQVGPCVGIDIGDQLSVSRFLLLRICEMFNVTCSFDPKPIPGDWKLSSGYCNYSNKATRTAGTGWKSMLRQIEKLREKHTLHLDRYRGGIEIQNKRKEDQSSCSEFTWGFADKGTSIRISRMAPIEGRGYLKDKRPLSDHDPFVVTQQLVETTLLCQSFHI